MPTLGPVRATNGTPIPHAKIWRYVDLLKLMSLLAMPALFFVRADCLGDPHEGASGKPNIEKFRQRLKGKSDDEKKVLVDEFKRQRKRRLMSAAVSCWHINNDGESAAMWSLYAPRGAGFAIQSTSERLVAALQARAHGRVTDMFAIRYADYELAEINEDVPVEAFTTKRVAFLHEHELRVYTELTESDIAHSTAGQAIRSGGYALLQSSDGHEDEPVWWGEELRDQLQPEGGRYIPVDVNRLIECVYVGPQIPSFAPVLLRKLLKHYGLDKPVVPSELDRPPFDQLQ
jgi:hypothetical protein